MQARQGSLRKWEQSTTGFSCNYRNDRRMQPGECRDRCWLGALLARSVFADTKFSLCGFPSMTYRDGESSKKAQDHPESLRASAWGTADPAQHRGRVKVNRGGANTLLPWMKEPEFDAAYREARRTGRSSDLVYRLTAL